MYLLKLYQTIKISSFGSDQQFWDCCTSYEWYSCLIYRFETHAEDMNRTTGIWGTLHVNILSSLGFCTNGLFNESDYRHYWIIVPNFCFMNWFSVVSRRHEGVILDLSRWATLWLLRITASRLTSHGEFMVHACCGPHASPIRPAACIVTIYCFNISEAVTFTEV